MAEISYKTLASSLNFPETTIRAIAAQAGEDEASIREVAQFMKERKLADVSAAITLMTSSNPDEIEMPGDLSVIDATLAEIDAAQANELAAIRLREKIIELARQFMSIPDEKARDAWLKEVKPEALQPRIRKQALLLLLRQRSQVSEPSSTESFLSQTFAPIPQINGHTQRRLPA